MRLATGIVNRRAAFLLLGVVCVLVGIVMLSASTVTCGDDVMQEGDVCLENGAEDSAVQLTYEEEKRGNERGGRTVVGVGVVALLIAGAGYTVTLVRRRRHPN